MISRFPSIQRLLLLPKLRGKKGIFFYILSLTLLISGLLLSLCNKPLCLSQLPLCCLRDSLLVVHPSHFFPTQSHLPLKLPTSLLVSDFLAFIYSSVFLIPFPLSVFLRDSFQASAISFTFKIPSSYIGISASRCLIST